MPRSQAETAVRHGSDVLGVAGNFAADLDVFAADLDVAGSVASISVIGTVRGATWNMGGDLRSLTVRGAIDGLRMTVGGTLKSASLGTVQAAAIDVGRRVGSFAASTFIGSHLHVGFTPMNSADPMADATSASFDPAVVTRIDSFRVSNRTAAVDLGMGQFRVRIV